MKTVNDTMLPIFIALDGDATLRSELGGSGKIYKSATKPTDKSNPAITLRLLPAAIIGEQSYADESLVWINLYLDNKQDMTPDMNKAHSIESRINTLLDEQYLVNGDTTVKTIRYIPGRLIPIDPESNREHVWNFQYQVIAK